MSAVIDPRLESVVERLERDCRARDASVQLAVHHRGEPVLDVAVGGGLDQSALLPVMSVSKALTGIVIARMAERGDLDLDAPVSRYWPEFAARDKGALTVEQLLSHQAGLPFFDIAEPPESWVGDDAAAAAHLAAQAPAWRAGAGFSYHAVTIGTLASELSRRILGAGIPEVFETEVRAPLGADAYLGVPEPELSRVRTVPMPDTEADDADGSLAAAVDRSLRGIHALSFLANDPRSHRAGHPAAGGVASASGLARVFAATLWPGGGEPLVRDPRGRATSLVVGGRDLANGEQRNFGVLFQKPTRERPFAGFAAFGHEGAGGAIVYADPGADLVFAFVPSRDLGEELADDLSRRIRHALTHPGEP